MLLNTALRTVSRRNTACSTSFCRFSSVEVDHYATGSQNTKGPGPPGKYAIQTFNKISSKGLERFPSDMYTVEPAEGNKFQANALLLRSHKLQEEEVDVSVRAIARCGAGTNNVPVARMTELGIPVFNTPGANANAVKELVLCGMFLGSRRVVDGINHMKKLGEEGLAKERVEKDKSMFGGRELAGKTLAVIGLGHIGAGTARDASSLGMTVQGYDPGLSIASALKLPREMKLTDSISSAVANADYVSLNMPYIKGEGGTHGIIGEDVLAHFKEDAVLLNFARGELVDSAAMKKFLDKGDGRYVTDFPDDECWDHKNAIVLPHLGASTEEAEDQAAAMAADTIRDYIEHGTIRNSVNFPDTQLDDRGDDIVRISVINENKPGVLSGITACIGQMEVNIVQQINQSRGDIAYNVIDLESADGTIDLTALQREMTMLDGVLSSRVLSGIRGMGYARKIDGEYHV